MNATRAPKLALFLLFVSAVLAGAQPPARITHIEGSASVLRSGASQWRDARPGMPLGVGDELYARTESFVEVRYEVGAVVRLNEETKMILEEVSDAVITTRTPMGDVWVNMRRLTSAGRQFDMATPTAVASIRGTSYRMTTAADSSTDVNVFGGEVAVGPSGDRGAKPGTGHPRPPAAEPREVPGPEEVPGPFEVPLEHWLTIVAGQRISVRADGKFAKEQFELESALEDLFVKKNIERDRNDDESR